MILERYVAVDNVCAWPNLTMMPDGSVIATIFNQPTHGGWEGDVECWASNDQGRTWTRRGTPARHKPKTNRMNVAAGLARDGALVVLASGWSNRHPAGTYSSPHEGEVIPPWVCRSEDGGSTWQTAETVSPPPRKKKIKLIPFGDILQLPGKQLGACIYSWAPPKEIDSNFYVSHDDGRSWIWQGLIARKMNETAPIVLADGTLLAAARTSGNAHLELFVSTDKGKSWTDGGPLTLGGQITGHLQKVKDGQLLLSYGLRNQGLYGIGARLSGDRGKSWQAPIVLLDFEIATDGGYPASVQFEDGTILTAYYCNKIPAHQRYHMGVIRWKLE
jgi:hypothetical protein